MACIDVRRLLTRIAFLAIVSTMAYFASGLPRAGAVTAQGEEVPVTFDIPAQPLSSALKSFAIQANLQMFFEEATVSGLQAPALVGQMSPHRALRALLANTQLEAVQNADGTYVVRVKRAVQQVAQRTASVPTIVSEASPPAATAPTPQLPEGAEFDPLMIRLRGVYVDPKNESDAFGTAAPGPAAVPRDAVHVNDRVQPELDFEYFFTPHISTELSLPVSRQHTFAIRGVGVNGAAGVGTFDWMPDVLTAKYNFLTDGPVRPYLGAGVSVTTIWNVNATPFSLSSTNVGPAAQAGIDFRISAHWFLNTDVKWARVRPELRFETQDITRPQFDPLIYAIGIGYRFGGTAPAPVSPPRVVAENIPQCPNTPAGVPVDAKGCPLDSDGDGVPDYLDKCPNTPPGVKVDAQGCPLDSDGDGVPDYLDKCPGTPPGLKVDANGCEIEELVLKGVNFETASAKLTPDSAATLDGVLAILKTRSSARAEIHGYTDSVGSDAYNQGLSERRANSVMDYLIEHGIHAAGLGASGYGKTNPVASNATAEGRAQNRRVTVQFNSPVAR